MVSAYTVLKFRDQLSNMYFGVALNQATLYDGSKTLQAARIDLLLYIGSQSNNQQTATVKKLDSDSDAFANYLYSYKKVSSFPIHVEFVTNKDIDRIVSDEERVLSRINEKWNAYHNEIKDLVTLSKDPSFRQSSLNNAAEALALLDELEASYQDLIALNIDLGETSYESSNTVVQLAYFYEGVAASISAACATGAAILVSKRVILGNLVKNTKIEMIETTLRDLLGEGADVILEVVRKEMPAANEERK